MNAAKDNPRVVFSPSGMRGRVRLGTQLDQAARDIGADLQSLCGGKGQCAKCRVRVLEGVPDDLGLTSCAAHLSAPTELEKKLFPAEDLHSGWRLACQAMVIGDVAVEVPDESRAGKQVICKAPGCQSVELDPTVRRHGLYPCLSGTSNSIGAWEEIARTMGPPAYSSPPLPDLPLLQILPPVGTDSSGSTTIVVRESVECIAVFKDPPSAITGVALDIGTTTLAAYLCDLETGAVLATASAVNPQVSLGEDVISRIAYANGCADGRRNLQKLVIESVNTMIEDLARQAGVSPACMLDMTCVGNTCMHHLFLGIDPSGLGRSPFIPVICRSLDFKARDLGIHIAAGAWVHMLPVIAGFVGADSIGVLLALEPHNLDENVLVIDVGTNGEIVVGNHGRLICASCATGPALEGATLRHGMRAAPGAIERVRIDPVTLAVDVSIISGDTGSKKSALAVGICGSGIIDAVAQMFLVGVIGKNGNLNRRLDVPNMTRDKDGVPAFVLVPADQTATGREICITQDDVRAVQMAKGAIHAAVRILMKELNLSSFDRVLLSGAFGSRIDPASALAMGLFPYCPVERVRSVGNAAGDGARLALLSRKKRLEAARVARQVQYIELTDHPDFQREFALAMWLPHMRSSSLLPEF